MAIGHIEKITPKSIEGWAIHQQHLILELKIQIAEEFFKLSPQWSNRRDISEHYGKEFQQAGFSCQLPPVVQDKLKASEIDINEVCILANGVELIMDCNEIEEFIPSINSESHILWAAQRDLNERLKSKPTEIYPHILASQHALKLSGSVLNMYWRSMIPLLCKYNEILKLYEQTTFSIFHKLEKSTNNWEVSLACAILTADMEIPRATNALKKIVLQIDSKSWINTECIYFTIKRVFDLESEMIINSNDAEQLRYAYLALLDAFEGEWFSRLHDLMLIEAMIILLENINTCTDDQQQDIIKSAIKHYGLNITFWQLIERKKIDVKNLLFSQAKNEWIKVQVIFNNVDLLNNEQLTIMKGAISFFIKIKNPEAEIFLREIVTYALTLDQLAESTETKKLIELLGDNNLLDATPLIENAMTNKNSYKKIWPSYNKRAIDETSNQLKLLVEPCKAKQIAEAPVIVVSVMRNEMIMLPHFLRHYRQLGVNAFIIADNCSGDGTREFLLEQDDVVLYSAETEYKYSHYGVAWQQAILAQYCLGKWALLADADELLVYPNDKDLSLLEFVKQADQKGGECIRTDMVDMYPYGSISEADFSKSNPFDTAKWFDNPPLIEWRIGSGQYSNGISLVSSLKHRLSPDTEPNVFTSQKYGLIKYKPWVRLSEGIHYASGVAKYSDVAYFAHFKYHAGFEKKVKEEVKRKQHYNDAVEYKNYLKMSFQLEEGLGDENISVAIDEKEHCVGFKLH